jgi:hypothetical protein
MLLPPSFNGLIYHIYYSYLLLPAIRLATLCDYSYI